MHEPLSFVLGFVVFTAGLFFFILGLMDIHDRRLIENTPTSKCRSVAMGLVELSGVVAGPNPMASLIAQLPCFISQVRVQQLRQRGEHRQWREVHTQQFKRAFYVQDDTGKVKVDPHGAVLQLQPDLQYSIAAEPEWSDRALERSERSPVMIGQAVADYCSLRAIPLDAPTRVIETNLCVGDPVYILGTATEQSGTDRIVVRSSLFSPLMIAESGEAQLRELIGSRIRRRLFLGTLINSVGAIFLLRAFGATAVPLSFLSSHAFDFARGGLPGSEGIFMSVPFLALIGLLAYSAIIYNGFVRLRNQVGQAWANVDVLLKQRFDLIPNLVEVCRGYMQHEREVLQTVVEARASWARAQNSAEKLDAARQSGTALQGILAVAENYPMLRANETFMAFQSTLTELEAQIADRRELYNAAVLSFNNRIAQVPDLWVAKVLGYRPRPFFVAGVEELPSARVDSSHVSGGTD